MKVMLKMFSNELTTSSSAVSNYGPYTSQNASREARNESVVCHTNLYGNPPNPSLMYVLFMFFITNVITLTVTNHVDS
jgi:hypothetical protein